MKNGRLLLLTSLILQAIAIVGVALSALQPMWVIGSLALLIPAGICLALAWKPVRNDVTSAYHTMTGSFKKIG